MGFGLESELAPDEAAEWLYALQHAEGPGSFIYGMG